MQCTQYYSYFSFNCYQDISSNSEIFSLDVSSKSDNTEYIDLKNHDSSIDLSLLKTKVEVADLKESVQEKLFKVHQLFNREELNLDSATLARLQIMANPQSWSSYLQYHDKHLPSYKTVTNYNSSTRQHVEEKIKQDPVLCASFAVAVAEGIAEGSNTTIPTRGGATWDLPKILPESHYSPQAINSFDKEIFKNLPNGTVLTAQYNGSDYKAYGPTHSMVLVDMKNGKKWLLHLFHTSMALTPVDDVRVDGSKFYMKVGGKNTGFTLVWGSSLIVPNYQTAESQEKRKNNPRKRYTIESRQAMTAYEFADSISKTLRIPVGAANMIVMDQNNISSLDQLYNNFKVTTLGRKQTLTPEQENALLFMENQDSGQSKFEKNITKKTNTEEVPKKETPLYSGTEKTPVQIITPPKAKVTQTPAQSPSNSGNTYKASEKVQKMYGNGVRRRG